MKINKFTNKKRNGNLEANILLENVKLVWCFIAVPDTKFKNEAYKLTCLLPKKDKQTLELIEFVKEISKVNGNKKITGKKYPIRDMEKYFIEKTEEVKNDDDLNEDEKKIKIESITKFYELSKENYFFTLLTKFEIPVIDLKGNPVENLTNVIFNEEIANIQFKLRQDRDTDYYSRSPQGIQLLEVKRYENNSMFNIENDEVKENNTSIDEDDDELPF